MSVPNRPTTQVVLCPSCGQYHPDNEPHTCGAAAAIKCATCGVNYAVGQLHLCEKIPRPAPSSISQASELAVGMVVADRYKILAKIGQGGMGAVYEAVQDSIERRVAIKILLPAVAQDHETAKRFINEARAVNRVNHPGLVQISDFGKLDSGTPYIVMEFLKGETLRQRVARMGGALPTADVMELGSQIAESLAAAHALGIVHRDLKPDNVMIVPDPHMPHGERTKLLDFGIAKFTGAEDQSNTRTQLSAVMGSPSYMSPEQCRGAGLVDDRTDVYALGCMLYEMLSGRPPFMGDSLAEVMGKHQFEPPLPLGKRTAGVPATLLSLVDRLLIKDKELRPTMGQLLEGLETLRSQLPQVMQRRSARFPVIRAPSQAVTLRHISTLGQSVGQGIRKLQRTPRRSPARAALLTLAVLTPLLLGSHRSAVITPRVDARDKPVSPPLAPPLAATTPPALIAPAEEPSGDEPAPAGEVDGTTVAKPARESKRQPSRPHKRRHGAEEK